MIISKPQPNTTEYKDAYTSPLSLVGGASKSGFCCASGTLFGPRMFEPSPSRVGSGSATLVSSTGKMGKLGSDEAGVTVSHSGGAAAVDDADIGTAAMEAREVLVEATETVELGIEVVELTSAAGKALSSVAQ